MINEFIVMDEDFIDDIAKKTKLPRRGLLLDLFRARQANAECVMYLKDGLWSQIFVNPALSVAHLMRQIDPPDLS